MTAGSHFNYTSEAELIRNNKSNSNSESSSTALPSRQFQMLFPPALNPNKKLHVSLSIHDKVESTFKTAISRSKRKSPSPEEQHEDQKEVKMGFENKSLHEQLLIAQEVVFNEELYQKVTKFFVFSSLFVDHCFPPIGLTE